MIGRIHNRFVKLGRDRRGTTAIEFALVAPVLAIVVMGVIDISMGYSARLTLEQAAFRALEKVTVGSVQSDYSFVRQEAAEAAGVPEANVTIDNWLECDRVRQTDFNGVCPEGQMISRYISVRITDGYEPRFYYGPLARAYGVTSPTGVIALEASASLRVQ